MKELRTLIRECDLSKPRVALAILTGSAALGSAVGLSAVAAWMIARAAGMPSPADLAIAAVVVRFFGIGRGLFRYLERLVSHDAALRGVVALRARVYERLAAAPADSVLSLRRGDTLARIGADVDAVGDAVVRGVIPLGVAFVVSGVAVGINAWMDPAAGIILAVALAVAAFGAAGLTWRAARLAAERSVTADARVTEAVMSSLDGAAEHRVWGTAQEAHEALQDADRDAVSSQEQSARPAAFAAALQTLCAGAALVGCVWVAVKGAHYGEYGPTTAAIIALLPLAAFEGVNGVPGAVTQLFRSQKAAQRIVAMAPNTDSRGVSTQPAEPDSAEPGLLTVRLTELQAAWPEMTPTVPITASVGPGQILAIVGRSGVGKTTVLTTIAGALAPHAGTVDIHGEGAHTVPAERVGTDVGMTAEDAHIFGTSVMENLRVARGDVTEDQAAEVLELVGLSSWIAGLPDGLDTVLGTGGNSVSGGERRRLLLARASLTTQPVILIDEPAEHLDEAGRTALRAVLQHLSAHNRTVVIVTHHLELTDLATEVVSLDA
ncbi:thiol reductant ABC exporter subunit CydC [Demequina sp. B12]|uniref:thiol reductant ABC exporter subunit CydC n=1 Tax=Demequina sp. B12 TaxID=2992757 RepID=UPI00237B7FE1|nr:thiol reductant ABC exporter subunit CydC [Demequina sp. B12]MDE0572782.1 thiol reductant ABC exporter subunit CydC [Demequina sp. B12]